MLAWRETALVMVEGREEGEMERVGREGVGQRSFQLNYICMRLVSRRETQSERPQSCRQFVNVEAQHGVRLFRAITCPLYRIVRLEKTTFPNLAILLSCKMLCSAMPCLRYISNPHRARLATIIARPNSSDAYVVVANPRYGNEVAQSEETMVCSTTRTTKVIPYPSNGGKR